MGEVKQLISNVEKQNKQNSSKNEELVKREDVKDSPFQIITIDGKTFGVMGKYRITEASNSKRKIKEELSKITWNRIIQVIMLLNEVNKEVKPKKTKKNNKK
jgi:translation elongation factor P/translation initiation factor 5A